MYERPPETHSQDAIEMDFSKIDIGHFLLAGCFLVRLIRQNLVVNLGDTFFSLKTQSILEKQAQKMGKLIK